MKDPTSADPLTHSLKRLTIALWIIAALIAVNLMVSLLALFSPALATRRIMAALPESTMSSSSSNSDDFNNFHDWPVEKQIQAASVIAVCKWQKADSSLKCIISEILKQAPNTAFHYAVGDEFRPGNHQIRDNTTYGDGQIVFFTGSPSTFRYSTTYSDDRVTGMGDMPIAELRELVHKTNQ